MGCPPWFTHSVQAVEAEEYGLLLDSVPQLSPHPHTLISSPIQFKRRPPPFIGLVGTRLRNPVASMALAAEVARILGKGAITTLPPHESHLGFYSRYFLVSKKSGEKSPILNLRMFNRFVAARKY